MGTTGDPRPVAGCNGSSALWCDSQVVLHVFLSTVAKPAVTNFFCVVFGTILATEDSEFDQKPVPIWRLKLQPVKLRVLGSLVINRRPRPGAIPFCRIYFTVLAVDESIATACYSSRLISTPGSSGFGTEFRKEAVR